MKIKTTDEDKKLLEEVGNRLKQIRVYIGAKQKEIAEIVESNPLSISRMERAKGGTVVLMIKLLKYYSQFVYINSIFADKFALVALEEVEEEKVAKSGINEIIAKMLDNAVEKNVAAGEAANKELIEAIEQAKTILTS
jgi:transcriptional regulator with XRE-family HTH domain